MADLKISALPASTTPLAGTEVLPIVQGGATKQVSVANLTAGRAVGATSIQFASGSVLSSYEEGTWTPVAIGATTAGTGTYTNQFGLYTKVGRLVTFSLYLSWTAHTGTGNLRISGLPFTVTANSGGRSVSPIESYGLTSTGTLVARCEVGTTFAAINEVILGNFSVVPIDVVVEYLVISGTYAV